jgi:hypothetical protein
MQSDEIKISYSGIALAVRMLTTMAEELAKLLPITPIDYCAGQSAEALAESIEVIGDLQLEAVRMVLATVGTLKGVDMAFRVVEVKAGADLMAMGGS